MDACKKKGRVRLKAAKLVRDKIIETLNASKIGASVHVLSQEEYIKCLKDKLLEEVVEAQEASDSEKTLEELADLIDVSMALAAAHGFSREDLEEQSLKKCAKYGGFAERLYCEYMEMDEDNSWVDYFLKTPGKYPRIS